MQPLAEAIRSRSERALAAGALVPIATASRELAADGAVFLVRVLEGVARKQEETHAARRDARNPFLPPEPELVVRELSETHLAVLNKFPVLADHLLIVTRRFETQESPLGPADFAAAWQGLAEIDALVFYNSGLEAGASQPHKHLQLVPLPLATGLPALPAEALIEGACRGERPGRSAALPFAHAGCRSDDLSALPPDLAAGETWARYRELLAFLSLSAEAPAPYNLLLTRRELLLVPRRRPELAGMPVNALGYAGVLLVRDAEAFEALAQLGPLALLRDVGVPTRSEAG